MFSDRRIRDALAAGQVGVWRWEVGADRIEWSPNLEEIHGKEPGTFDGTFASFAEDIHPDDRDEVIEVIEKTLAQGGAYEVHFRLPPLPNRSDRWLEARGMVEHREGDTPVMTGICHDITPRKLGEIELATRLKQQEAVADLSRFALETDDMLELYDRACRLLADTLEVEMTKVLELTPDKRALVLRAGIGWRRGAVGNVTVGIERDSQAGYTLLAPAPVVVTDLTTETRFSGPTLLHDHGVIAGMSTIIAGANDAPFGVLGVHTARSRIFTRYDVNFLEAVANILGSAIQRVAAAEQQDFLFHELRHRVGNLFAQMNAILRLSARTSESVEELCDDFANRIIAAGEAHSVISRYGWSPAPLRSLLEALLRPYAAETELSGPDVVLPADVAFPLGLAINELATNAAKYGCFREQGGRLSISWQIAAEGLRRLSMQWIEHCGHDVEPPKRTSFGTNFIDTVICSQLQGALEREFAPEGLRLSISIALPAIQRHPSRLVEA